MQITQILLMLAPSVVTPQNQYFPANAERMSVHCLESGCIGKYTPPLGSVRIQSVIIRREGSILTLSILPCPQDFLIHSL